VEEFVRVGSLRCEFQNGCKITEIILGENKIQTATELLNIGKKNDALHRVLVAKKLNALK
jgi:hypothetical protein